MSNVPGKHAVSMPSKVLSDLPLPEVWGGVESTINRVGDHYLDQLARSGHASRIEDLDLFAGLGIKAIRYPVLWEKVAPGHIKDADWTWPDTRLERLRNLGIRPITGLIHHGSGPRHTSLIDPAFPEHLAKYAAAVARRYPWVEDYTPVNEPLTTARFSTLYGHWYPHERNDRSFARALVGQCRAIVLAMRAVREVNPAARLIQTEELGKVHSTPALAYQADFENERRWLTFDLLSGKLTPGRRLWRWLVESGVSADELEWFLRYPCPPNVLGVNYYLTSERFLDERVEKYSNEPVGSNGIDTYVDVSAARALPEPITGICPLLQEAWSRYHIPIAITEVHNGSTREEQLRWLHEIWNHAIHARDHGIDLHAVTVWALLGSYDWPSLLTCDTGIYEPGAFDLRNLHPRPTALARMTRDLATRGEYDHPVLDIRGWWRRPDRFGPYTQLAREYRNHPNTSVTNAGRTPPRKILIVGEKSDLTSVFSLICERRHIPARVSNAVAVPEIDEVHLRDVWAVILARHRPFRSGGTADLQAFAALCDKRNIPCVWFTRTLEHQEIEEERLEILPNVLSIDSELIPDARADGNDEGASSRLAQLANVVLDLLLDCERGVWHIRKSGEFFTSAFPASRNAATEHPRAADD